MEKVKLPRHVAEALDEAGQWADIHGISADFVAWCIPNKIMAEKHGEYWKTLYDFGYNGGFLKLIDALRYGYEVEPEPITVTVTAEQIEKAKELYHSTDPSAVGFENGWRLGFTAALDAVGIKIHGVNA